MSSEAVKKQLEALEGLKNAHGPNLYFYDGPIDNLGYTTLLSKIVQDLPQPGFNNGVGVLYLQTEGGDASAAYKIASIFQSLFTRFEVAIYGECYSAGTLVALGANKLSASTFSEIGPLDVQILKEDELGQRRSGLTTISAFEALGDQAFYLYNKIMLGMKSGPTQQISFKLASDLAAQMTCDLMAPIYAQISPMALGEDQRRLMVANEYGRRLAEKSKNLKPGTLDKLVSQYPEHSFVINNAEMNELFSDVGSLPECFFSLQRALIQRSNPLSHNICSISELIDFFSVEDSNDDTRPRESDCNSPTEDISPNAEDAGAGSSRGGTKKKDG